MKLRAIPIAAAIAAVSLGSAGPAQAEGFKSPNECVPGRKVTDMLGKTGTVIGLQKGETVNCAVRFADGREQHLLFWMLHPAGGSRETNSKLVPGKPSASGTAGTRS
jgi:hypothetical protein